MFNSKALTEKWSPVLSHEGAGTIKDNYRKAVTAVLLENTESQLREERGMINEASNTVGAIGADGLSCLLYTSPSPRDTAISRMPSSA